MSLGSVHSHENKSQGNHQAGLKEIQHMLNRFQHNLPLSPTPYADMALELGMQEKQLLALLQELKSSQVISRVGAVFKANRVGASTLAAMAVPKDRLIEIADIISAYPAVNHNYEREHHFNLWFVVTSENKDKLNETLKDMEDRTGIVILSLPMEKDYHIDLGFPLQLIEGGKQND